MDQIKNKNFEYSEFNLAIGSSLETISISFPHEQISKQDENTVFNLIIKIFGEKFLTAFLELNGNRFVEILMENILTFQRLMTGYGTLITTLLLTEKNYTYLESYCVFTHFILDNSESLELIVKKHPELASDINQLKISEGVGAKKEIINFIFQMINDEKLFPLYTKSREHFPDTVSNLLINNDNNNIEYIKIFIENIDNFIEMKKYCGEELEKILLQKNLLRVILKNEKLIRPIYENNLQPEKRLLQQFINRGNVNALNNFFNMYTTNIEN